MIEAGSDTDAGAGLDAGCPDVDGDGVCDGVDICDGYPDASDADGDGIPDECDCDQSGSACDPNAVCTEESDGIACTCIEGHEGDGQTCTLIDCGEPTAPLDGSVSAPMTTYGSTATYACDMGFTLVGSAMRHCELAGTWSGMEPTCAAPAACAAPTAPLNGSVAAPRLSLGAIATYYCNVGYQLLGANTSRCSLTGWLGATPTCLENLRCACGGAYAIGERVRASVPAPSGASEVVAGQIGTVIAGDSGSAEPLLIEWDGWTGGTDGNCGLADCGTCAPRPALGRWWTACNQFTTERLACMCDGAFSTGDRVLATSDITSATMTILIAEGTPGTIVAGRMESGGRPLVEWDGWTRGHDGNCEFTDCGSCTDSSNSRRYVPCDVVGAMP